MFGENASEFGVGWGKQVEIDFGGRCNYSAICWFDLYFYDDHLNLRPGWTEKESNLMVIDLFHSYTRFQETYFKILVELQDYFDGFLDYFFNRVVEEIQLDYFLDVRIFQKSTMIVISIKTKEWIAVELTDQNEIYLYIETVPETLYNVVKHPLLGTLCCYGKRTWGAHGWGKRIDLELFGNQVHDIICWFDLLYTYNQDFRNEYDTTNEVNQLFADLNRMYCYFQQDYRNSEVILYHYYQEEVENKLEDIRIESVTDLYGKVFPVEVRIFQDRYVIVVTVPWEEYEKVGILKEIEEDPFSGYADIESEVDPVEMAPYISSELPAVIVKPFFNFTFSNADKKDTLPCSDVQECTE